MTSDGQSNSEVITTNNTVLKQILSGDVRKNYYMVGSTWTNGGAVPNGAYSPQTPNNTETTNCFGCHNNSTNPSKTTVEVSHIWTPLMPLFQPAK